MDVDTTIHGGDGGNTFYVSDQTFSSGTLTLDGGAGGDTFDANAFGRQSQRSSVASRSDVVNLGNVVLRHPVFLRRRRSQPKYGLGRRSTSMILAIPRQTTLTWGPFPAIPAWVTSSDLAPALITYEYAHTASLTINTSGVDGSVFGVWEDGVTTTLIGRAMATVDVGDGLVGVQTIIGTLNIENPESYTTINIDDSADDGARTTTMGTFTPPGGYDWGYITGLAPANINYKYEDTTSVTINGSTAIGNVIDVLEDGVPTTLNLNAEATVNVGDGYGGLSAIQGQLTVNSAMADDVILNLNDRANATGRTVTMTSGSVIGLAPAEIDYGLLAVTNLNVNGGFGTNTFNVLSTPITKFVRFVGIVHTNTTINTSGSDTVNVGDANGVQDIQGPLTVNSAVADFINLNLNDQTDATGRTVTMADGIVIGLAPAEIDYGLYALANLNINGGTVANVFNVLSTPVPEFVRFVGIAYTNTTINSSGPDTVNVGDANGVQDIQGPLAIDSVVPNFIKLSLNDQADATGRTVTITSSSVSGLAPADIDFGLDQGNLDVNGGSAAKTFNVQSTAAGTSVTTNTGSGTNVVNVGDNSNRLDAILGACCPSSAGAVAHCSTSTTREPPPPRATTSSPRSCNAPERRPSAGTASRA